MNSQSSDENELVPYGGPQLRVNAIKNGLLKTKKIGCKQKRSDANKKPKPVKMQTKKIGCKQKRICKLKRKWNNVERARADTKLAIFRVNEAN